MSCIPPPERASSLALVRAARFLSKPFASSLFCCLFLLRCCCARAPTPKLVRVCPEREKAKLGNNRREKIINKKNKKSDDATIGLKKRTACMIRKPAKEKKRNHKTPRRHPNKPTGPTARTTQVLQWLVTDPDGVYVDCTLGGGGHSAALLNRLGPGARVVGLDRDPAALREASERLAGEVQYRSGWGLRTHCCVVVAFVPCTRFQIY